MKYLKNLAVAAALGLSLAANPMEASSKSKKAQDPSLSLNSFNQVIKGYDCREFFDADGDRIDSADEARDVAHTTVYKVSGKPIARAVYDDDGRIVRLEAIAKSPPKSISSQKPAAPTQTAQEKVRVNKSTDSNGVNQQYSKQYNINWKHLDSILANPEYQGSVHDLYKFGLGVDTFEQRKQLIRDYFRQEDYVGNASQNEAHLAAFSRIVQERDGRALGPLYAAAKDLVHGSSSSQKPATTSKPYQSNSQTKSRTPKTAPQTTAVTSSTAATSLYDSSDDSDKEDTDAPSGDLEQKLYSTPAQSFAPTPAQAPVSKSQTGQTFYGTTAKQTLKKMRENNYRSEEPRSMGPEAYDQGASHSGRDLNSQAGGNSQASGYTTSQQLTSKRVELRNKCILSELRSKQANPQSLEERTAGNQVYRSSIPASCYDSTRLALHRVVARSHVHQTRNISRDLWTPLYSSLMRHNEQYRFLPNGMLDFENSQFEAAMVGWITKYQNSGTSNFAAKEWGDYRLARGWLNDAYSSSSRLQNRFARDAGYSWSPITGSRLDDFAMNQTSLELYCAQQEFWKDHRRQKRRAIGGFVLKIGAGYLIGRAIGGRIGGGHGGGGQGAGHAQGFVSGGTHYVSPGVGNAFR